MISGSPASWARLQRYSCGKRIHSLSRGSVLPSRSLQESNETAAAWVWRRYASDFFEVAADFGVEIPQTEPAILEFFMELLPKSEVAVEQPTERQDLWLLLLLSVVRRGLMGRGEPALTVGLVDEDGHALQRGPVSLLQLANCEPNTAMRAYMSSEFAHAFEQLGHPVLIHVLVDTLRGLTAEQIAQRLGCVPWTVIRKQKLIRLKWTAGGEDDD